MTELTMTELAMTELTMGRGMTGMTRRGAVVSHCESSATAANSILYHCSHAGAHRHGNWCSLVFIGVH